MSTSVEIPAADPSVSQRTGASRSWITYAAVSLAVLAAFCVMHHVRPVPGFPYDDPFIDLHSAQVLHTGTDPNYPGVPALFGVTSAPFLGLIYLLLFVFAPLQALNISCWIGVLLYALGLVRLARVMELRPREQWLLVWIGLATAPIPVHWFNGLETSCALAAITWTLAFAAGKRSGWTTAAFLAGLCAGLRPDFLPFAVLLTGWLAWQTVRLSPRPKNALLPVLGLAVAMAVPVVLCGVWYFHLTGSPVPLTGVAKRYFFAEDRAPLVHRVMGEYFQLIIFLIAVGPLALTLRWMVKSALGRVLLAAWAIFLVALFVQFPGEIGTNEFRYPVVLIPTLIWGLGWMLQHAEPPQHRQMERLMIACAGYAVLMLPVCLHYYRGERHFFEVGQRPMAMWCEQHLPAGTSILVHDAGYLAYSTGFRTVDFVGLKTPSAIGPNRRYTWPSAGRDRAMAVSEIATESGSRYLVLNSHWWPVVTLTADLRALGWKVELLDTEGAFQIYAITPPAA